MRHSARVEALYAGGSLVAPADVRLERMFRARRLLPLSAFFAAYGYALAVGGMLEERAALYLSYGAKLDELATECRAQQLNAVAEELTGWLPKRSADHLTLFVLTCEHAEPAAGSDKSAAWHSKWRTLRDAQAEALMALARRALAEHQPSLAYQLVTETLRENPDHKLARRMLGYVRFRDAWHTPFAVKQLNAGKRWHDSFGWLPQGHVDRYERGERNYQGRWLAAEAEVALRHNLKPGFRSQSEP